MNDEDRKMVIGMLNKIHKSMCGNIFTVKH